MGKQRRDMLSLSAPDPECRTLAYMIAKRVTHPMIELDCTILITGLKGSGKSIFSIGLGWEIAKCLAVIKNKKLLKSISDLKERKKILDQLAHKYFNMRHVTSVDKEGTMEMFSGDVIMTPNAVLVCDDVSITADSRKSMTNDNKALTQVMTVSRPFRNVVILNTVYSGLIDKRARNFADIVIEVLGVNPNNKTSLARAHLYTVNQSNGKEYKKYFTVTKGKGKDKKRVRVRYWVSHLPPKWLRVAYKTLRMQKTKELIEGFGTDREEEKHKGKKRGENADNIINTFKDIVVKMKEEGCSIKEITRHDPSLTEYWVNKILAQHKKENSDL